MMIFTGTYVHSVYNNSLSKLNNRLNLNSHHFLQVLVLDILKVLFIFFYYEIFQIVYRLHGRGQS